MNVQQVNDQIFKNKLPVICHMSVQQVYGQIFKNRQCPHAVLPCQTQCELLGIGFRRKGNSNLDGKLVHCRRISVRFAGGQMKLGYWYELFRLNTQILFPVSLRCSSSQKGPNAPNPSLSGSPRLAFETLPVLVWLNSDCSQSQRVDCWPLPFILWLCRKIGMV